MSCIDINLNVAQPILLSLVIDNGYCIIPDQVPASEPIFLASEAFKFEDGDKAKLDLLSSGEPTPIDATLLSGEIYGGLFQP